MKPDPTVVNTRSFRSFDFALAALLFLGIRIVVALSMDVWLDEANTLIIAGSEPRVLLGKLHLDSSPPLYYLLLHFFLGLFPQPEFAARMLSIAFGLLTLVVLVAIGNELKKPYYAKWALFFFTLSPIGIYYTVSIRMYSLLMLLAALTVYFYLRATSENRYWLPFSLFALAMLYCHNIGVVMVFLLSLLLVIQRPPGKKWLGALAMIWVCFLPWSFELFYQTGNTYHYAWIKPFWQIYPNILVILRTFESFVPGGFKYPYLPLRGIPEYQPLILLVYVVLFGISGYGFVKKRGWDSKFTQLVVISAGFLILLTGYSLLLRPIYVAGRSDIIIFPLFALITAGLIAESRRPLQLVWAAVLVTLSLASLACNWPSLKQADSRRTAEALVEQGCRNVLLTGFSPATIIYYNQQTRNYHEQILTYPTDLPLHLGNLDYASYSGDDWQRMQQEILANDLNGYCLLLTTNVYTTPLVNRLEKAGYQMTLLTDKLKESVINSPYRLYRLTGRTQPELKP